MILGILLIDQANLRSNLELHGVDKNLCIIKRNPNVDYSNKEAHYRLTNLLQAYNLEVGDFYENININNLTIDGNLDNLVNKDTQLTDWADEVRIDSNIKIRLANNITIKNNIIKNAVQNGLHIQSCNNVKIYDNEIFKNGYVNFVGASRNGINCFGRYYNDNQQTTVHYKIKNIEIKNNIIHDNCDEGVQFANSYDIKITGNNIYQNGDRGIEGDNSVMETTEINSQILINNNIIKNNKNAGVTILQTPSEMELIFTNNILTTPDTLSNTYAFFSAYFTDNDLKYNINFTNNICKNTNTSYNASVQIGSNYANVANNTLINTVITLNVNNANVNNNNINNKKENSTILFLNGTNLINLELTNNILNCTQTVIIAQHNSNININSNIVNSKNLLELAADLNNVLINNNKLDCSNVLIVNNNNNKINTLAANNNYIGPVTYNAFGDNSNFLNFYKNGNYGEGTNGGFAPKRGTTPRVSIYNKAGDMFFNQNFTQKTDDNGTYIVLGWLNDGTNVLPLKVYIEQ